MLDWRIDPDNLSNSDEADFQIFLNQLAEYEIVRKPESIFAKIDVETGDMERQLDEIITKIKEEIAN